MAMYLSKENGPMLYPTEELNKVAYAAFDDELESIQKQAGFSMYAAKSMRRIGGGKKALPSTGAPVKPKVPSAGAKVRSATGQAPITPGLFGSVQPA